MLYPGPRTIRSRAVHHAARLSWRFAPPAARDARRERLTYLSPAALWGLHRAVRRIERHGVRGSIIEAGCALGGSALVIAAAKAEHRPFEIYDLFGMPPPPGEGDGPDVEARYAEIASGRSPGIGGDLYYGYVDQLRERVIATFVGRGLSPASRRIRFIPGLVQETLRPSGAVALAHIDCDRHASVLTCLERIAPSLSEGGMLLIDDYGSRSGCTRAVDGYFRRRRGFRITRGAQLVVTRERSPGRRRPR